MNKPGCSSKPVIRKATSREPPSIMNRPEKVARNSALSRRRWESIDDVGRSAGAEQCAYRASCQTGRNGPPLRNWFLAVQIEDVAQAESHHENTQTGQQRFFGQIDQQGHTEPYADQTEREQGRISFQLTSCLEVWPITKEAVKSSSRMNGTTNCSGR